MLVPSCDVLVWWYTSVYLLAVRPDQWALLMDETRRLAEKYSLAAHTQSALELINLPPPAWPMAPAGWLARAWHGRVAVW